MENEPMKKYVLGFLVDNAGEGKADPRAAMIFNTCGPQNGLWNGLGGKVENGETPYEAMVREFLEEGSVRVTSWCHFCTFCGAGYEVDCFVSQLHNINADYVVGTDDLVEWMPVSSILSPSFYGAAHILWLVPMAIERTKGGKFIAAVDFT